MLIVEIRLSPGVLRMRPEAAPPAAVDFEANCWDRLTLEMYRAPQNHAIIMLHGFLTLPAQVVPHPKANKMVPSPLSI